MLKCVRRTLVAGAALCTMLSGIPASAQSNLSGVWNNLGILNEDWPDRLPGPELGDYAGLPVNDAVRARADAWDASLITLPEYQCRVHPSDYVSSFAGLRIWEERDSASQQLIAIHTHHFAWGTERTIWMDGRPHPPDYAMHTAMGFSTGKWDGDILVATTTHLKEGWTRRNGLTRSDSATVTEHFIRHGDTLTLVISVDDPEVLHRARRPLARLRVRGQRRHRAVSVRAGRGNSPAQRRDSAPPAGYESVPGRVREGARHSARGRARRRRNDVSGVPEEDGGDAEAGRSREVTRTRFNVAFAARRARHARQPGRVRAAAQNFDDVEVKLQKAQGNVYMLVGAGGNVTVQIGAEGVVLVDTQFAPMSTKILAAVRTLIAGAAPLHHQHAQPRRPRGRQREPQEGGRDDRRRQRDVRHRRRRAGRADHLRTSTRTSA